MASLSLCPVLKAQFMASAGDTKHDLIPFGDGITGCSDDDRSADISGAEPQLEQGEESQLEDHDP
eukprot:3464915-Rhodomonas_salina.1